MYYGQIKKIDVANGEGVRVSLFVSGCRNRCKGCFQKDTWDFCFGTPFTQATEDEIIWSLGEDYISGLTILGGEPFEEENQTVLTPFLRRVKLSYPDKNIWCYTGYIYERDLKNENGRKHIDCTEEMLSYIDVLVDGPFILEKKNISLPFRGSENQRIIRLHEETDRS